MGCWVPVESVIKLIPCPFCGGEADPEGWLEEESNRGPKCGGCGATSKDVKTWNTRPRENRAEQEGLKKMKDLIESKYFYYADVMVGKVLDEIDRQTKKLEEFWKIK